MRDPLTLDLAPFHDLLGEGGVVTDADRLPRYTHDQRDLMQGHTPGILRPRSTGEVQEIVRLAGRLGFGLVPQGGNTSYVGGATPEPGRDQLVVSLERMGRIRSIDPTGFTLACDAGTILADAQAAAEAQGCLLPLSLGSEGSCRLGGNLGTNAGGLQVLRYGMTRDLVLGLEAVLPDGSLFSEMRALRKNNIGYDLKQLFIGAEGTLGIVTAAVLKIFSKPRVSSTALVMLDGVQQGLDVMALLRGQVGDRLASLEIMSRGQIEAIRATVPDTTVSFALDAPWYLIIELTDTLVGVDLSKPLEGALGEALERGLITDALFASSEAQAKVIWRVRHSVSEANKRSGMVVSHDSAVPIDRQAAFAENVERRILEAVPHARVVMHG